jgi:hypothetical protein
MSKEFVSIQLDGIKNIIESQMDILRNLIKQYDNIQMLLTKLSGEQKEQLQTISENIQTDIGSMLNKLNELFVRYTDLINNM